MRVGIYAETLTAPNPTGISNYTRGLIGALESLDEELEIVLYYEHRRDSKERIGFKNCPKIRKRGLPFPNIHEHPKWWWNYYLPFFLRIDKVDIFHGPNHIVPQSGPPTVCTIHDLAYYKMKVRGTGLDSYLKRWTQRSMETANRLITVSDATKRDCIAYGIGTEKIKTVYQGFTRADQEPTEDTQQQFPAPKSLIKKGYYLFVGTIQPRKNLVYLVREFEKIAKKVEWDLVIAGAPGESSRAVKSEIETLDLHDRVHLLGFITDKERLCLFRNALAFVYPSLYEGFGLPVLESMSAGVPVIASDNSSLPEAVGKAGILVDVSQENALAESMLGIYRDPRIRDELIQSGYDHIQKFTWQQCAKETHSIYQAILEED